ncbi:MAG: hypothetical protein IT183_02710 [Acidobacteria bacterium]|jgi:hypothetical protein|nr:hypothetical protein [Acidobacteriota bacterium]
MRPLSARLSSFVPALALGALLLPVVGCGSNLPGTGSSYVMIQSLQAASGAKPDQFTGTLASDVQTLVDVTIAGQQVKSPTVYEDPGRVVFALGMKNPTGLEPTSANFVTFNRYRVNYIRSDGRNTPGVDVPHPFDGAITVTVTDEPTTATLTLVRIQSKLENPLLPLVGAGGALAITTLAEVTFYGTDQAGREVSATGRISVTFADWGDPD